MPSSRRAYSAGSTMQAAAISSTVMPKISRRQRMRSAISNSFTSIVTIPPVFYPPAHKKTRPTVYGTGRTARGTTQLAQQGLRLFAGIQQFPAGNGAKRGCHTCRLLPAGFRSQLQGDRTASRPVCSHQPHTLWRTAFEAVPSFSTLYCGDMKF